ncbi:TPM domain-containing protein [Croceicoccus naphthovorans]|uniref:Membrane protein n=1 Tax=Croceicoccus naphthovorans TaxID=1348774 RepID=A0A0G3XEZ2_9SPHN|nr:TPM domain-containing protein [Croceicoccus naphthovorans]AKM09169.1 membrane protein [Croceicoccus naphthovorans]MBB3990464.1 putative membrane protein [Croceicoccus naphthovorans]
MSTPVYLSEAEHRQITDAVAAAELTTSGEIVTVLARRSDGYSDIALAWAALAAFTAITVLAIFPDFYLGLLADLTGQWNAEWSPATLFGIAAAFGILKFLGTWAVQLWPPLKYLLIPRPVKTRRTHDRAVNLFKVGAERRTHGRTGILIYLSMQEHRAEIVADSAIAEKVEAEVWGEAMAQMIGHVREGRVADGMIAAVEEVGKVLAQHFPREEDDQNELPDRLIEL